jgi:Fe-Mn family superoxide dismutase
MEITRRHALGGLAALGAVGLTGLGGSAMANDDSRNETPTLRAAGQHALRPLPFAPGKLRGLSERLLVSHHENNYGGALKNLNKVEEQLASVTKDTPAFVVAGLKERELTFSNSVTLHELYFANLGGDGKATGTIASAISDAFGGFGRFEESFRATGMSLAGGSGWTVLDYCFPTDALRIHWSGGHSQSAASAMPLLVLDMYEHAFALDYGAAAAKYVDAFFANVQWEEVSRRLDRARAAARAMKG